MNTGKFGLWNHIAFTYLGGAFMGLGNEVGAGKADPFIAGDGVYGNIKFDASMSNKVYGNSTIVQPNAIRTTFVIRYKP